MHISHDILQEQIVKYCKNNNIYHISNRNESSRKDWAKAKLLGIQEGASDLEIKLGDKHFFLEIKVGRDKQRKSQIEFQKYVESFGYKYLIISSFEQFLELVNENRVFFMA